MKRFLIGLIAIMMFTCSAALAAPVASDVGVVDVGKVIAQSPKIKALQEQLNQKAQELSDKIEAEKSGLTAEQLKQKQEAAYKAFLQYKKELELQIEASVRQATEQVAQEKKLSLVLYNNAVRSGGIDITADVISKMR